MDMIFEYPYFSRMMIFSEKSIQKRRSRLQEELKSVLKSGDGLIIFSGDPIGKPGGLDQTYPYLAHPIYYWLTGNRRPGSAVFYSLDEGWQEYLRPVSSAEIIWEGVLPTQTSAKDIRQLESDLTSRNVSRLFVYGQPSLEEKKFSKSTPQDEHDQVKAVLDQVRRQKDPEEVQLIKNAAQIAKIGYQHLRKVIKPGISERELQIEFESEIFRAGAHQTPYETIIGSGTNAAILHAIPTTKKVNSGELILVDAGVDLHEYCVDITRVFAADGKWSTQQKQIIDLVHTAQKKSISACHPGTAWSQVHRISAEIIAEGLIAIGLCQGSTEDLLESGAIGLFFPHGVGHMVGLRVRDVGYEQNKNPQKHCGVNLRVDMDLAENQILTVEPGCYFIKALLEDSEIRKKYQSQVRWNEVEKWMSFGGVRIEDNILITDSDPVNLTEVVEKAF